MPDPVVSNVTPSMRPFAGMTWPMVAYAFVRELPYTAMIVGGAVLGIFFVLRNPASALEPIAAVLGPAIVSALGRSRPAEFGQVGGLAALFAMWKGVALVVLALALAQAACTPQQRAKEAHAAERALDTACAVRRLEATAPTSVQTPAARGTILALDTACAVRAEEQADAGTD